MSSLSKRRPLEHRVVAVFVILLAVAGCDRGFSESRLSGRVLIDGKPLGGGTVRFIPSQRGAPVVVAQIDENGGYGPVTVACGEVMVAVDNRALAPRAATGGLPLPGKINPELRAKMAAKRPAPAAAADPRYIPIPARYYIAEEAEDVKFTVTPGEMKHDIELSSKQ